MFVRGSCKFFTFENVLVHEVHSSEIFIIVVLGSALFYFRSLAGAKFDVAVITCTILYIYFSSHV